LEKDTSAQLTSYIKTVNRPIENLSNLGGQETPRLDRKTVEAMTIDPLRENIHGLMLQMLHGLVQTVLPEGASYTLTSLVQFAE
jgi:hypothetical protein